MSTHAGQYGDKTADIIQEKMNQIQAIENFKPVFQNQGIVILEVI